MEVCRQSDFTWNQFWFISEGQKLPFEQFCRLWILIFGKKFHTWKCQKPRSVQLRKRVVLQVPKVDFTEKLRILATPKMTSVFPWKNKHLEHNILEDPTDVQVPNARILNSSWGDLPKPVCILPSYHFHVIELGNAFGMWNQHWAKLMLIWGFDLVD